MLKGNFKILTDNNYFPGFDAETAVSGKSWQAPVGAGFTRAITASALEGLYSFRFTKDAVNRQGSYVPSQVITINPGDVNTDRSFAVICLPRREITFGHVPYDALPELPKV